MVTGNGKVNAGAPKSPMRHRSDERLAELVPYARNARTHSPAQVKEIAASISEFGFTNPVLIDEAGMIVAGHGRVLAAQRIGLVRVPVIVLEGLTELQKRCSSCVAPRRSRRSCPPSTCSTSPPRFVDVIVDRWQEYTGETAYRESDGASFASLSSGG